MNPPRTFGIVCAHNEASRISPAIRALQGAGIPFVVIDDGSTDPTANVSRNLGANVVTLPTNLGKGNAMRVGMKLSRKMMPSPRPEDALLFCDADLQGLRPDHLLSLAKPMQSGRWAMIAGLRDYGPNLNPVVPHLPLITGERAVRRDVLESLPDAAWNGYGIETWINYAAHRSGLPSGMVLLDGLRVVPKWDKTNTVDGLNSMVKMGTEVADAHEQAARWVMKPPPGTQGQHSPTDELCQRMVQAAAPFVRQHMWTPEAQKNLGMAAGKHLAIPFWTFGCIACTAIFGPLAGVSMAVAAFIHRNSRV